MPDPATPTPPPPAPPTSPLAALASQGGAIFGIVEKAAKTMLGAVCEQVSEAGRMQGRAEAQSEFLQKAHDREVAGATGKAKDYYEPKLAVFKKEIARLQGLVSADQVAPVEAPPKVPAVPAVDAEAVEQLRASLMKMGSPPTQRPVVIDAKAPGQPRDLDDPVRLFEDLTAIGYRVPPIICGTWTAEERDAVAAWLALQKIHPEAHVLEPPECLARYARGPAPH